jgi:hypothetical protein
MTSLVYGIVRSTQIGWADRLTLAAVVAGGALLILFVLNEARAKQPITPLRLFASGERTGAYLARFLFIGANFSFLLFFFTLFLQGTRHAGPLVAGLAFLPVAIPSFLTGVALPPIAHRFGNARVRAVAVTLAPIGRPPAGRQPRRQHARDRLCRSKLSGPRPHGAPRTPHCSWTTGGTVILALALLLVAGLIIPAERRRGASHGAVSSSSSERRLAHPSLLPLTSQARPR